MLNVGEGAPVVCLFFVCLLRLLRSWARGAGINTAFFGSAAPALRITPGQNQETASSPS